MRFTMSDGVVVDTVGAHQSWDEAEDKSVFGFWSKY